MSYVDGFVTPVKTGDRALYLQHAREAAAVMKRHGAQQIVECWGDDVPDGKLTSFPLAVQRQPDETVVFSWVTWPSRAARDEGWKSFMADPWTKRSDGATMPFDAKRMIYGGFEVLLES